MPRGDGSGPNGMGPMTGRAAGLCAGYATPGFMNPVPGGFAGMGRGRGGRGGWGRRNWYHATGLTGWQRAGWGVPVVPYGPGVPSASLSLDQEKEMLRQQAESLGKTLSEINQRLEALENEAETDR